jgi:hypothetical protein
MRLRLLVGALILLWVLGGAYWQARRRGRRIGLALFFLGAAVLAFASAGLVAEPPLTPAAAQALVVAAVVLLALAMLVVLLQGFRR